MCTRKRIMYNFKYEA